MGQQVVAGALMTCSFGTTPCGLVVLPSNKTLVAGPPAATIMDNIPIANIPSFGMCNTPSNPAVASATAAALGVLTPMPCVPVIPAPWVPGSPTVLIGKMPALNNSSTCTCAYGGVISFSFAGQATTMVP